ncbi:hypothetical protein E2C01_015040 [Portunus trituberculatus]|uniref:Uncharacterized protein n=1 Tax=Portunus trituberculatus TaxID=210409 RepID=A0A5B7DLH8_PORTR|nr:hypothetical protein [Portunus trituberculatus]
MVVAGQVGGTLQQPSADAAGAEKRTGSTSESQHVKAQFSVARGWGETRSSPVSLRVSSSCVVIFDNFLTCALLVITMASLTLEEDLNAAACLVAMKGGGRVSPWAAPDTHSQRPRLHVKTNLPLQRTYHDPPPTHTPAPSPEHSPSVEYTHPPPLSPAHHMYQPPTPPTPPSPPTPTLEDHSYCPPSETDQSVYLIASILADLKRVQQVREEPQPPSKEPEVQEAPLDYSKRVESEAPGREEDSTPNPRSVEHEAAMLSLKFVIEKIAWRESGRVLTSRPRRTRECMRRNVRKKVYYVKARGFQPTLRAASLLIEGRCRLRINRVAENMVKVGGEVVTTSLLTQWPYTHSLSPSSPSLASGQGKLSRGSGLGREPGPKGPRGWGEGPDVRGGRLARAGRGSPKNWSMVMPFTFGRGAVDGSALSTGEGT